MRRIHVRVSLATALTALTTIACDPVPEGGSDSSNRTDFVMAGDVENVSYGRVERFSGRIVVPEGRSRQEVIETLQVAARRLAEEQGADAVMVFGYRPGDTVDGMYTVGRAIYAPNGKWEDAAAEGPMRVVVDLNELYFAAPRTYFSAGDTVSLESSSGENVLLSNAYGEWGDENVVGRVVNGSRAVILEKKAEPMGQQEFVRYRIRILGSPGLEGWIHESDAKQ